MKIQIIRQTLSLFAQLGAESMPGTPINLQVWSQERAGVI